MSNGFEFEISDRVRDKNGNFGTVMARRFGWDMHWCLTRAYGVLWDGERMLRGALEVDLFVTSSYKPGDVVFYKGVECLVHAVAYTTGRLLPVNLVLYKSADPCRTQFYVDEKEVTRECPAPKKLGADALKVKVKINISDLPEVQKVLSEASEAFKISEQHRAKLGHDLEELAAEIVALRESLRERDKRLHKAEEYTLAVKNNLGFVVSLRCSKGVYDIAEMLSDNVEKLREKVGELGKTNASLNKRLQKLNSENENLSGLLTSERGTVHLLLKTQRELVGERDMLRATMEAREKQPPRNAEVQRLEAEIDRLSSELNRVRSTGK